MSPDKGQWGPSLIQLEYEIPTAWAIYRELPETSEAKDVLESAPKQFPGLPDILREIGLSTMQEISDLGLILRELIYSKLVETRPLGDPPVPSELLTAHYQLLAYSAWISEAILNHVSEIPRDLERGKFTHTAEATKIESLIQWVKAICDKKNWYGDPPYYIFITDADFPDDLHRLEKYDDNHIRSWASGFGQRLIVPNKDKLDAKQKDQMWSYLLTKLDIYQSPYSDQGRRESVFRSINELIPTDTVSLVDVAGGRGDFAQFLKDTDREMSLTLIDNAADAVDYAADHGIRALHIDMESGLPNHLLAEFDIATITFSIQWLETPALKNTLGMLKSGGTIICNIYPPGKYEIDYYRNQLSQVGFVHISEVLADNGIDTIIIAKKP